MAGFNLDETSVVICFHAGFAEALVPYPRACIEEGDPVVAQDSPYVVEGCLLPPPPIANGPCIMGEWIVSDVRLFGEGIPLLGQFGEAVCEISGTGLLVPFANPLVEGE